MPRAGRELEQLVARLESLVGPWGASVTSPEYIRGGQSGSLREVDIAIRGRLGSSPVLVIVECRDRSGPQDVTWIEQLASKRVDVGADIAVAVATGGFSEGALQLARATNVRVRTVAELTDPELLTWLGLTSVIVRRGTFQPETIDIGLPPGTPDDVLLSSPGPAPWNSDLFWSVRESRPLSPNEMYGWLDLGPMFDDLASSGRVSRRGTLTLAFPSGDVAYILRDGAKIPLGEIRVSGIFSVTLDEVSVSALFAYGDTEKILSETAELDLDVDGVPVVFSMHKVLNDDGTAALSVVAFTRNGQPLPSLDVSGVFTVDGHDVEFRKVYRTNS